MIICLDNFISLKNEECTLLFTLIDFHLHFAENGSEIVYCPIAKIKLCRIIIIEVLTAVLNNTHTMIHHHGMLTCSLYYGVSVCVSIFGVNNIE